MTTANATLPTRYGVTSRRHSFCTLGPFILDQVEFKEGTSSWLTLGGAGTYAALGARIVAGKDASGSVTWTVDVGSDFPLWVRDRLDAWDTSCVYRLDASRKTTRARICYEDKNRRSFHYMTPKLQLDHNALTPQQVRSAVFHMVCEPTRGIHVACGLIDKWRSVSGCPGFSEHNQQEPLIIWEPGSDPCTPANLTSLRELVTWVKIFSPNADELAGYFGSLEHGYNENQAIQDLMYWTHEKNPDFVAVIRQGSDGSCIYSRNFRIHLRAYYQARDQDKVLDTTGAGNTFLGAFGMVLSRSETTVSTLLGGLFRTIGLTKPGWDMRAIRMTMAGIIATVVASFVLEQIGVPKLGRAILSDEYDDLWNGIALHDRLSTYILRESSYTLAQQQHKGDSQLED